MVELNEINHAIINMEGLGQTTKNMIPYSLVSRLEFEPGTHQYKQSADLDSINWRKRNQQMHWNCVSIIIIYLSICGITMFRCDKSTNNV